MGIWKFLKVTDSRNYGA